MKKFKFLEIGFNNWKRNTNQKLAKETKNQKLKKWKTRKNKNRIEANNVHTKQRNAVVVSWRSTRKHEITYREKWMKRVWQK